MEGYDSWIQVDWWYCVTHHNHTMHPDVSSSYRWTVLGLGFVCVLWFYYGQRICVRVSYFVYFHFVIVWLSVPMQLIVWKVSSLKW